jgi:hypothetical protein
LAIHLRGAGLTGGRGGLIGYTRRWNLAGRTLLICVGGRIAEVNIAEICGGIAGSRGSGGVSSPT